MRTFEVVASQCWELELIEALRLQVCDRACKMKVRRADPRCERLIEPLADLFNNQDETWCTWIRTGALQSVVITIGFPPADILGRCMVPLKDRLAHSPSED
jgi:hypothetical protein